MRMHIFLLTAALFCIVFTTACQSSSPGTPIPPTDTPAPSATPQPSLTPSSIPTLTPAPTSTPTTTPTKTTTSTPTRTPTSTPSPTPVWPEEIHDVQVVKAARQADRIAVSVPEGVLLLNWEYQVLGFIPLEFREDYPNKSIALSTDGTLLAVGKTGSIQIFSVPDGALKLAISLDEQHEMITTSCQVNEEYVDPYYYPSDVSFAPDGYSLLSSVDNCILEWDVNTGLLLSTYGWHYYIQGANYPAVVKRVEFSPDGSYFVFRASPGMWAYTLYHPNVEELTCIWQLGGEEPTCYPAINFFFSWDGSLLVMGGIHNFGTQFYDAVKLSSVRSNTDHWARTDCMTLSADNRFLADGEGDYYHDKNPIVVWNIRSWKKEATRNLESSLRGALFSPRDNTLLLWTDILQVWDYATDSLTRVNIK